MQRLELQAVVQRDSTQNSYNSLLLEILYQTAFYRKKKMKKVGIITYHFAQNYGAVLQCYALQTYLSQQGYAVTVFDFVSEKQQKNNDVVKHGASVKTAVANICLLPFTHSIRKKHARFVDFCQKNLHLTPHFSTVESLEQYIEENGYDVVISGSDQVLNPNINDFEIAFLYPFKTKAKKIAYAASTGNASPDDIQKIQCYLDDFSKISIREQKDIGKFDAETAARLSVVCDPVMLLRADTWNNMLEQPSGKPYLICYFLHKKLFREEFAIAQKIAKSRSLELKVINARFGPNSFRKGTVFDAGPREFVNLIANASYVCTDSFHGTLFSLIFHKQFSCLDTKQNHHDTRKKGLLESVGATAAYQNIEDPLKICSTLNYEEIDCRMDEIRKSAAIFLEILDE